MTGSKHLRSTCLAFSIVLLASSTVCAQRWIWAPTDANSYWVENVELMERLPADAPGLAIKAPEDLSNALQILSARSFKKLTRLTLLAGRVGDLPADTVSLPPSITTVTLVCTSIVDSTFVDILRKLPHLSDLSLTFNSCDPIALDGLRDCSTLARLSIAGAVTKDVAEQHPDIKGYGSAIAAIASVPQLAVLDLHLKVLPAAYAPLLFSMPSLASFCSRTIGDEALLCFGECESALRILNLNDNLVISDVGLQLLHQGSALTELHLAGCRHVGDHGLDYIARIKGLRVLDLSASHLDVPFVYDLPGADKADDSIRYKESGAWKNAARSFRIHFRGSVLAKLVNLEVLRLRGVFVCDAFLEDVLAGATKLAELDLTGCTRSSGTLELEDDSDSVLGNASVLAALVKHPSLTRLTLNAIVQGRDGWNAKSRPSPVTKHALEALKAAKKLRHLSLSGALLVDFGTLSEVSASRALRTLAIRGCTFVGKVLGDEDTFASLEVFDGQEVSSEIVLAVLSSDSPLRELSVASSTINSALADIVGGKRSIRCLRLLGAEPSESLWSAVAKLDQLEEFETYGRGDGWDIWKKAQAKAPAARVSVHISATKR